MQLCPGRGEREDRGGSKGKELEGRKRGWIFLKNLLRHADEKLSVSIHTEAMVYFS